MATKVFISWSGDQSRTLAEALRDWLPVVLQSVTPYFTPVDTEKGSKWEGEVARELQESQIGIICLTRQNTEEPWILFEAGALSKHVGKSRVCTVLLDLDPSDLEPPLSLFQATSPVKDEFRRLLATINNTSDVDQLEEKVLDRAFDKWWPELQEKLANILQEHPTRGRKPKRGNREIIEEILALCRFIADQSERDEARQRQAAATRLLARYASGGLPDALIPESPEWRAAIAAVLSTFVKEQETKGGEKGEPEPGG